jgi:citrate synthase
MEMFFDIKEPENAEKYILNKIKNKDLIIGFGHRVYKKGDSRVPTMTKILL